MQHNAMRALPNLWLDVSQNHLFDGLRRWSARYGSKRLVFGSGLPGYSPGSPKYQLLRSGLDAGDMAAVAHGNLESLLGLEKSSDLPGAAAPLPCPLVDIVVCALAAFLGGAVAQWAFGPREARADVKPELNAMVLNQLPTVGSEIAARKTGTYAAKA
jgi:hypothetical protein